MSRFCSGKNANPFRRKKQQRHGIPPQRCTIFHMFFRKCLKLASQARVSTCENEFLELVFIGNICGFSSNFFADKAKICRHTFVWQEFLTQYATKFAEKT